MNNISSGCYIVDADFNIVNMNSTAHKLYPQLAVGKKCYTCLMGLDSPCPPCPVVNHMQGPKVYRDPIREIAETVDCVEIDLPEHGTCHMLVFSTVDEFAVFAATLPTSSVDLQNLALVQALTSNYIDVFSVNIPSDVITLYRHNGLPVEDSYANKDTAYSEAIARYIDRYVVPEDRDAFRTACGLDAIAARLKESESFIVHYRVRLDGEVHYYNRKHSRIGSADDFVNFVVGVGCEDEEVQLRMRQEALEKDLTEMEIDSQTGLYTKEAFFLRAEALRREHPDRHYDYCVSKIDNLNLISHQYGRMVAEKVTTLVGRKLSEYSSAENCIAYFGNGYYASLTVNEPREQRKAAVFAFRDSVIAQSDIRSVLMKWAIYVDTPKDVDIETIHEKTHYALTMIRTDSNEEYIEFDRSVIDRMDWEEAVRSGFEDALRDGEFRAWYQPKYSAKTKEIVGAEALVRWIRPNGEMLLPGRFIPILEKWSKIHLLDEHIFRLACELRAKTERLGLPDVPISVNLSRASISLGGVAERYTHIAETCGVDPAHIPIEITESAAIRALAIRSFTEDLLSRGFVLHMDDFGSGYSSLASLHAIPFKSIKLDKSLVDFIGNDSGENLLKHAIAFAKESGKSVTAEGVETVEQYIFLKALGCDAIQGYYFSKPVDEETFLEMLRENARNA